MTVKVDPAALLGGFHVQVIDWVGAEPGKKFAPL
jgi:hypothetical protein